MTQEELQQKLLPLIDGNEWDYEHNVLPLINQHIAEVIGKDESDYDPCGECAGEPYHRNELKAEQRKRAGV
jgi:hypothetical protein